MERFLNIIYQFELPPFSHNQTWSGTHGLSQAARHVTEVYEKHAS